MAAAGAIGLVHDVHEVWFLRLFLAGVLLTPLAFASHRLGRRAQFVIGGLAAAGVLAALVAGLPEADAWFTPTFNWPFRLTLLAALLVPFVASGRHFTRFVRRFFEETTTWGLLWLGAMAAIAVVFLALKELFDLRMENLGIDAAIAVTAGFILVYLHRLLDDDPATTGRMPELWRRLATTIGAPFVSVMLAILVIYEIVALVRGELPRNMLSPLIMAAGFVGFVSTLIISSVLGERAGATALQPAERHRWAREPSIRLARAFPIILIVLLPMAGWALWIRVEQYGFTPFRAVRAMGLLCLATLSLAGALRWLRGRAPLGWEVPGAVLVFALAAAFGPTSVVRLSIASQARLVGRWLDDAGAGRIVGAASEARRIEVDPARHRELRDAIEVIVELGGEPAIRGVLSGAVELCTERWRSSECLKRLGVYARGDVEPASDSLTSYATLTANDRFSTGPGQLAFVDLSRRAGAPDPRPGEEPLTDVLVLCTDSVVVYTGGKQTARASLTDLTAAWQGSQILPSRMLPLLGPDGTTVAELAVQNLELRRDGTAAAEVLHLTGAIVWRR
jgi:hypothetical protein